MEFVFDNLGYEILLLGKLWFWGIDWFINDDS